MGYARAQRPTQAPSPTRRCSRRSSRWTSPAPSTRSPPISSWLDAIGIPALSQEAPKRHSAIQLCCGGQVCHYPVRRVPCRRIRLGLAGATEHLSEDVPMSKPTQQLVAASLLVVGGVRVCRPCARRQDARRDQAARPASCAASIPALRAFRPPTARATGSASTWTSAAPSPRPCSGDAKKVKWVPLNAQQRFTALQSGEVDILSRNTTFTLTRDASLGLDLTPPSLTTTARASSVPKKGKITSAKQLKNAEVCVQSGTTTEKNLTDYFKSINAQDEARRIRGLRGQREGVLLRAAARPTRPTRPAWPRSATRKRRTRTTT